jgi:hypothetical protein
MLQFTEHQRSAVTRILVDVESPNLVHSSGLDGSVFTYDLKSERRVNTHNVSAYTDKPTTGRQCLSRLTAVVCCTSTKSCSMTACIVVSTLV